MILGLKSDVVELADHDSGWETIAAEAIQRLRSVFGLVAKDIQHVGSTAIRHIKAKPIIDIVVAVDDFDEVKTLTTGLESLGFMRRDWLTNDNEQMLYAVGYDVEPDVRVTTHFIHIVINGSIEYQNYINFRDYLNVIPSIAKEYETIKIRLAAENPYDKGREKYLAGKRDFIIATQQAARIWVDLGKMFVEIEPINKGLSDDKKYYIKTIDGQSMFLRVSDISEQDRKKIEYEMSKRVYALGVLTPQPIEFSLCNYDKSVYSLSGWLDGEDVEKVLPFLSETEQYVLGLKAGEVLRKIHSLPAPEDAEPWLDRFSRKVQGQVDFYNTNPIKSDSGDKILCYLQSNRHMLGNRTQTFCHGDFNIENLMVMPDGQVAVLDFNSYNSDHGDPWWEFCSVPWGTEPSAYFYTGFIRGYFDGEPPHDFFEVLSYYFAYNSLAVLCDTCAYNQGEPEDGRRHMENILRWFDNMQNPIPTWYLKDFSI